MRRTRSTKPLPGGLNDNVARVRARRPSGGVHWRTVLFRCASAAGHRGLPAFRSVSWV